MNGSQDNCGTGHGEDGRQRSISTLLRYGEWGIRLSTMPYGSKGENHPWKAGASIESLIENVGRTNVVAVLGEQSGGLVDVDLDDDADLLNALASIFLPDTGWIAGRESRPLTHRFYRLKQETEGDRITRVQWRCPEYDKLWFELRGDGHYTVVEPSLHPGGEWYENHRLDEPTEVGSPELLRGLNQLAAAYHLVLNWPRWATRHHDLCLSLCGTLLRQGWPEDDVRRLLDAVLTLSGDDDRETQLKTVETTVKRIAEGEAVTGFPTLKSIIGDAAAKAFRKWLGLRHGAFEMSDTGNAKRFVHYYGTQVRYDVNRKRWLTWTGTHWQEDAANQVQEMAKDVAALIRNEAAGVQDEKERGRILRFSVASGNVTKLRDMVKAASSDSEVTVKYEQLNRHPFLLNFRNGTLDLRSFELTPHEPSHLMTKCLSYDYSPDATSERWDKVMADSTSRHPELREYVQTVLGLTLIGRNVNEVVLDFIGPSGSGKSTVLQGCQYAMEDYAASLMFDSLGVRGRGGGSGARNDLMRLDAVRLVVVTEPPPGIRIDTGLLKSLSGNDKVQVRDLYQGGVDMQPSFTMTLAMNDTPKLDAGDDGLWRRFKMIHFDSKVPADAMDESIKRLLTVDADDATKQAIVAWQLAGLRRFWAEGLQEPQVVTDKTNEIRYQNDAMGQFIEYALELTGDERQTIGVKQLWNEYVDYCWDARVSSGTLGMSDFNMQFAERSELSTHRTKQGMVWKGVRFSGMVNLSLLSGGKDQQSA